MPSFQHQLVKYLLTAAAGPIARRRPTINSMRLGLELSTLLQFMPWNVHFERVPAEEGLVAEWINPEGADEGRVLLYLHGGAYVMGSLNTHRGFIGALAQRCGMRALSADYRKAPENPFPAALHDAVAAWKWLLRQGYRPQDVVLAGDSAGGGLVLALLQFLRDAGQPMPAAALCLSPWTDLALPSIAALAATDALPDEAKFVEALEIRAWGQQYAGQTPLSNPLLSPLYADLHNLPPLLLQVSDGELLYNDTLTLAARARAAGVPVTVQTFEGLVHWWHLFWRTMPEAKIALLRAGEFVKGVWRAQEASRQIALMQCAPKLEPKPGRSRLRVAA